MKRATFAIACMIATCPVAALAVTGVSVGGKAGYATYTGDVLPASGDVGTGLTYGVVIEIATLPAIDFEVQANYFAKDFTYRYEIGGVPASTEFEFSDLSLIAFAKKNLLTIPASPVRLYVGAGLGWYLVNTEVLQDPDFDPSQADDPVTLLENTGKVSGHGMVGVTLSPPALPLSIFAEGRYGRIFSDEAIDASSIEGGLMLRF